MGREVSRPEQPKARKGWAAYDPAGNLVPGTLTTIRDFAWCDLTMAMHQGRKDLRRQGYRVRRVAVVPEGAE